MDSTYGLRELKEGYREIQEKFELPLFKEMNEDFNIEKIDEEPEILIREVRRFISDKFSNYIRLIETLINPSNAQIFVYSIVKTLGEKEKNKLKELYKILSKKELDLVELDLEFSETKEVEFVKESFKDWQKIKKDLLEILSEVKKNWENEPESKSKNYFG